MKLQFIPLRTKVCIGVFLLLGVAGWTAWTRLVPKPGPDLEVSALLDRLRSECDPEALSNNYSGTTTEQPTELACTQILKQLQALGPVARAEVQARLKTSGDDEFGEMLVLAAVVVGDDSRMLEAARLMVWSGHPAVRLCMARELKKRPDPRTVEWFQQALHDDRFVLNDACMRGEPARYYPVRVVAELALRDMGEVADAGR